MSKHLPDGFSRNLQPSDVNAPRSIHLVASAEERANVAARLEVSSIENLEAQVTVKPWRRHGLKVAGEVSATVGQVCTISMEPMTTKISETFDERLYPAERVDSPRRDEVIDVEATDDFEVFSGDTVDLGALALEYLVMAIDPYPKRDGAVLEVATDDGPAREKVSPFAVLANKFRSNDDDDGKAG